MLTEQHNINHPYHHGNVKEALIDAAMSLIASNSSELISLRRLSKEVGVTPSAVYNHFADKNTLMLAIKIRIYDCFNRFVEQHSTDAENPEQALLEACLAYYHFSKEFPSQFDFLFSSTLPMEWSTAESIEVCCRGIVRTRKLVFDIYQKYQVPCNEEAVVNAALLVWSQLHGIVMLKNSGSIAAAVVYQDWPQSCSLREDEQVEKLIDNNIQIMLNGILNNQRNKSHH